MPKKCLLCKYWEFYGGSPEYSDYTPGDNWSMGCLQKVWICEGDYLTISEFRQCMNHAKDCNYYTEVKED